MSGDFFVYPCHTFEEAHSAAFSHTGSLERLSNNKIKKKYKINVPEPANYYKTNKTPAEFLDFLKSAPFFMSPSWCVTANKNHWDVYNLSTEKNEQPKCYIIISKAYPNVRFCIVLNEERKVCNIGSDSVTMINSMSIREFRDPWQIGGGNSMVDVGKNMMDLAFNKNNYVENIIKESKNNIKFKDIVDGKEMFKRCAKLT